MTSPVLPEKLEKGSKVQVLSGAFAGKTGTVEEVLGKGEGVRVRLGLLSTVIALEALEIAAKKRGGRSALHASHHRPTLAATASGKAVRKPR